MVVALASPVVEFPAASVRIALIIITDPSLKRVMPSIPVAFSDTVLDPADLSSYATV